VDSINIDLFNYLLEKEIAIVVAPITHNNNGQLLNTNADTIAQEIAKSMSESHEVNLIFGFEKTGVLKDYNDEKTVIRILDQESYKVLKEQQVIFAGMIPKLDNAFAALNSGVKKVMIGKAEHLCQLITGDAGTTISKTNGL
jgi:acetylglutamate kinase